MSDLDDFDGVDGLETPEQKSEAIATNPDDWTHAINQTPARKCSKKRDNGKRCTLPAVNGTEFCEHHLQKATSIRTIVERRSALAMAIQEELNDEDGTMTVNEQFLTQLESARRQSNGFRRLVEEDGHTSTMTTFGDNGQMTEIEVVSVEMGLLLKSNDHYTKLLIQAHKLGIEEQVAAVTKQQSDLLLLFAERLCERLSVPYSAAVALDVLTTIADIDPDESIKFSDETRPVRP